MRTYKKQLRIFKSENSINLFLSIAIVIIMPLLIAAQKQTSLDNKVRQQSTISMPLVDYHQHLLSPDKARVEYDPPLPAIQLPEELKRLINAREKAWNDKISLGAHYTEDSIMLNTLNEDLPTWIKGQSAVAEQLSNYFAKPYRITPIAYKVNDSTGFIAGYYSRGEGESIRHFGHIFLLLSEDSSGKWLIAAETPTFPGPFSSEPSTADQLVDKLDDAGIKRAVVLSAAYQWGSPFNAGRPNEYEKVKAENDYIAREVNRFPKRLVGFCSFNPLKDYALEELSRCQKILHLKGLKLHFGNSRVDIRKPEHLDKVRQVLQSTNKMGMPVVIHLWADPAYETEGGQYAKIFLEEILPEIPDVTIQVAHMAGGGRSTDSALAVLADAIAAGDKRTKNLYFDVATLTAGQSKEGLQKDAMRMRQIGLKRILYGTDTSPPNPTPRVSWANFKGLMPLTPKEIKTIAENIAPYLN
jgi:predicted TIM-barrel fold metal-dependent hydrolase